MKPTSEILERMYRNSEEHSDGIYTRLYRYLLREDIYMTAYKNLGWDIKDFPNAYAYYENLITLPLHTNLTDEEVDYVIENFKEVVEEYLN